jgi:hypothetical protein
MWHWVFPDAHWAQSASAEQLPSPSCPHLGAQTPFDPQIWAAEQA